MNDYDPKRPAEQDRRPEPERTPPNRDGAASAEEALAAGTPDAVKESESRRAAKERLAQVRGRGVDWVRPTDLFAQRGGDLSRRGVDLTAASNRRLRAPLDRGARWAAERARRLPPLSAFGRRGTTDQGQVRSGIGMR